MDQDEEEAFLPLLRPFLGGPDLRHQQESRREERERERERRIAGHIERHARPSRQARGLARAQIVGTAVAVADAEGTEAVSMRRIARELRAGTMSLYWHVASKEELHQLMLEKVQAEVEVPVPSGDWRADLRAVAHGMRATLLRHPWAIDLLGGGPPSGPNTARNADRLMAALDGLGLDLATVVRIGGTVVTYVLGAALREVQEIRWHAAAAEALSGRTQQEIEAAVAEFGQRIRASGRYPHIERIMDENLDPDAPETRDERFEFGLDCVLDGIAARLPAGRG